MNAARIIAVAGCALVATGVGLGFATIGSPSHARIVALDARRTSDLTEIAAEMRRRYGPEGASLPLPLPTRLPSDLDEWRVEGRAITRDPRTNRTYVYRRESPTRYALCATYALASEPDDSPTLPRWSRSWERHHAGTTCFAFDVTTKSQEPVEETDGP